MAKLSVEFDTDTKELSVKVDGVVVENAQSFSIYTYEYDEKKHYDCCIQVEPEEVAGVLTKHSSIRGYANVHVNPVDANQGAKLAVGNMLREKVVANRKASF